MDAYIKEAFWRQFGASIDMFNNVIDLCPLQIWDDENRFWYIAYHSVFFLDYYLTLHPIDFLPPVPFDLSEFEDRMPERTYSKEEVLIYLSYCKEKCRNFIINLPAEASNIKWENESKSMSYSLIEILIYNIRHVQHHTAQLNLLLRQNIDDACEWINQTEEDL
jgi:hypothetical protein